ncbi:MAG: aminoglycoside 3-N-acetyltransferase [Candidatus Bathyarchaeota archaeon]|nr:aminoglycoside 3-N-acetyltransferase [Candidatus Bathyarchaeota archaeon]
MRKIELPPVTRSKLVTDLGKLGVSIGNTIMLHASVKAIGWIVGGPDIVIQALLDVLGHQGTLMMYVGWEDSPYDLARRPENLQRAYLEECPPFDPARSRAYRKWSILTEYLRTWPGAYRSSNPEGSCVAVGAKAQWITENHPLQYGYGPGSPLAKLCEAKGTVLLLGAPFGSITLLHFAEHMANVPNKRIVQYRMPILRDGQRVWVDVEEFDTCGGVLPNAEENFQIIPREYLASGKGHSGKVGMAQSHLFDAADLTRFAIQWLERKYGTLRPESQTQQTP